MAKNKGDWYRIPVALILQASNIPIYWIGAATAYINQRWGS